MTQYDEFDDPRNQQAEELQGHVKTRLSSQMRLIGQFVALVLGITVILGGAVWGLNSFVLNQFEPQNTPVVPAEEDTAFKTAPEGEKTSPDSSELVPGSDSAIFDSFKSDAEKVAEAPSENILDDTTTTTEATTETTEATEAPTTETTEETADVGKTENLLDTPSEEVTTDITDITEGKSEETAKTEDAKTEETKTAEAEKPAEPAPAAETSETTEPVKEPETTTTTEETVVSSITEEITPAEEPEEPKAEEPKAEEPKAEEKTASAAPAMKSSLGTKVEKLADSSPKNVGNNNSVYKSVYDEPYSPGKVYPPSDTAKTAAAPTATNGDMASKLLSQPVAGEGQPIVAKTNSLDERTAGANVPSYEKFPNVMNRSKVSPEQVLSSDVNDDVMPAAGNVGMKPIVDDEGASLSAPASTGGAFVQLGSVRTQSDAEAQWQKLQKNSGALLASVAPRFVPATIEGQGQFIRIQAGPLSEADANTLCQSLNNKSGGSCLVVR